MSRKWKQRGEETMDGKPLEAPVAEAHVEVAVPQGPAVIEAPAPAEPVRYACRAKDCGSTYATEKVRDRHEERVHQIGQKSVALKDWKGLA